MEESAEKKGKGKGKEEKEMGGIAWNHHVILPLRKAQETFVWIGYPGLGRCALTAACLPILLYCSE